MTGARSGDLVLCGRLLREARAYWPHLLAILGLSLLSAPLALLAPLPMTIIVDSVIGARALPPGLDAVLPGGLHAGAGLLAAMVVLLVLLALAGEIKDLLVALLKVRAGEKLVLEFRGRLFRHLQRLSFAHHDARGASDAVYRIQYDAQSIQSIVVDGVVPFVTAILTLISMLYVTLRIDAALACVALAITPVLYLLLRSYRVRLRGGSRDVKRLETSALAVAQEVLSSMRVVQAFGQEEREQARFFRHSSAGVRARVKLAVTEGSFGLLVAAALAVGSAAVLWIGARHVQAGALTLGQLLLLTAYLAKLYDPLKTISRKTASLQSHLAGAERAFSILDREPDVTDRPRARRLVRATGAVRFEGVSFAYDGGHEVLREVSFAVDPGTRVAITGATGSGKTTLVSLLARFFDPQRGRILLDGADLRDYRLADLREQFAMVLQDPILFSTTIAENIAYARPGATDSEVMAAARAAGAHGFIHGLPEGYATLVGERGMLLSGGERQRIALARAFLKDAPVLILDEPTSSLDARTEAGILESLERLVQGRTAFLITHRPAMLAGCSARIHLEEGRLVAAPPAFFPGADEGARFPGR